MRIDSLFLRSFLATALAGALGACNAGGLADDETDPDVDADADEIESALERENGGLDTEDEAPMFGDEDGFADAQIESETVYDDAMERDPATTDDMNAPDATIYHATVLWGQMPPDFDSEAVVDWTGSLSVNRGAVLIRRIIAFEDRTDSVDRRRDRRTIGFSSVTRPHVDGFRLTIIDPRPESDEPLVLTYTPVDGATFSTTIEAMLEGPQSHEVDDLGNRMVAVAMRDPVDVCDNGFVRGRWHRVRAGLGRLYGHVNDAEGELLGHVRGVFGQRRNGERVFFGKFIDRTGRFRGIFGGNYRDGHFAGRWIVRGDPDHGIVAGEYRESRRTDRIGGHFLGRWAETSCNLDLER